MGNCRALGSAGEQSCAVAPCLLEAQADKEVQADRLVLADRLARAGKVEDNLAPWAAVESAGGSSQKHLVEVDNNRLDLKRITLFKERV